MLGPQLERLIRRKGSVRLRIIDVDTWGSPVARQYEVRRLPSLWLYDGEDLISDDTREVLDILQQ